MPSTGIVRNEVLECVPLDGINGGTEMTFRCIFCKHAIERAHGAVIRPQVSQYYILYASFLYLRSYLLYLTNDMHFDPISLFRISVASIMRTLQIQGRVNP